MVDDDPDHVALIGLMLARGLRARGRAVDVHAFDQPAAARAALPELAPAVVLLDQKMPGTSGVEWVACFVSANAGPVLMSSSHVTDELRADARASGAAGCLVKHAVVEDPSAACDVIVAAIEGDRGAEATAAPDVVPVELRRDDGRPSTGSPPVDDAARRPEAVLHVASDAGRLVLRSGPRPRSRAARSATGTG